ncbi:MAG: tRNA (guanosine(46)-N7)-methyltransferase TrmB [Planctomycetes bacterium]|nr:tRNA (guanosine(46)-N7)-methyltransferase TrmB [Planctomycetota bacterium]
MGRRALRKVNPDLDLSFHYRTLEDLPAPLDAEAVFGRAAPLEIEMGSGKGLFLDRVSEAHPERDFVGLEVARKYARFAAARLARHGRTNTVMVQGDGVRFFREWLRDGSIAAVHVYFPDPWWKKRHHKRRVMREEFLRDIERVLQPGGELHFWTDVEEYFHETLSLLTACTSLAGPFEVPESRPEHELDYRTHFERRMRLHGEPVYRSRFKKSAAGR